MSSPVVHYESFKDDDAIDPKCVITKNDDDSYSVRDIRDMVPSTTVVCCDLDEMCRVTDLDALYYCLPCLYPYQEFSEEDGYVITSVRWKGKHKGHEGGYFPSNIFITVQLGVKVFSARVSQRGLHVAGARSRKEASGIIDFLLLIIEECREFHNNCVSNASLFLEASEWLSDYSRGNPVSREVVVENIAAGEIDVTVYGVETDYYIWWPAKAPEEYHYFIQETRERLIDLKHTSEIVPRALSLINCRKIYTGTIGVSDLLVCMVNYNYRLDFWIDRHALTKKLVALGYNAGFHNIKSTDIVVNVVDENTYDDDIYIRKRREKMFETVFKITRRGKITCSGCGERQERAYRRLMTDIVRACDESVVA